MPQKCGRSAPIQRLKLPLEAAVRISFQTCCYNCGTSLPLLSAFRRFLVCGGDGTVTWVLHELEARMATESGLGPHLVFPGCHAFELCCWMFKMFFE